MIEVVNQVYKFDKFQKGRNILNNLNRKLFFQKRKKKKVI